jgi:hypothetical protein
MYLLMHVKVRVEIKVSKYRPGQARQGSRRLRLTGFLDDRHMAVRFSTLRTGRL